jgi:hypothetical protein
MSHLRKRREFVLALALVLAGACTAWHTTSLEPQRFSAEKSPELARLTLTDGTRLTARHPVLVGDSLAWMVRSGRSLRDSARTAVPTSSIRQVEVNRVAAGRTILLLGIVSAVIYSIVHAFQGFTTG